ALLVGARQPPQLGEDAGVHREDVVEAREVLPREPLGDAVEGDAPLRRGGARTRVGGLAGVPVAGAAALDGDAILELRVADHLAEDALGGGGAADVAEADETDGDRAGRTHWR